VHFSPSKPPDMHVTFLGSHFAATKW